MRTGFRHKKNLARSILAVLSLAILLVVGCGVEHVTVQGTAAPAPTTPPTSTPLATSTPIPLRVALNFDSEWIGGWRRIHISLPEGYDPLRPVGYPVIYLLDGDWYFDGSHWRLGDGGVVGITSRLAAAGDIPQVILVGIGYVGDNNRGEDFLGGFYPFYRFLTEELIPFIDEEYHTDPSAGRTLIGHSDGGYFTLYAFFQSNMLPERPFRRFIAFSGDYTKNARHLFAEELGLNRQVGDGAVLDASLFLAVGGHEEGRFVDSNQQMAERLDGRRYQEFRFRYVEFGALNHSTIVAPAIRDGLRWVFEE
jgi:enterochelin esterase-like enzyme